MTDACSAERKLCIKSAISKSENKGQTVARILRDLRWSDAKPHFLNALGMITKTSLELPIKHHSPNVQSIRCSLQTMLAAISCNRTKANQYPTRAYQLLALCADQFHSRDLSTPESLDLGFRFSFLSPDRNGSRLK